MREFLENNTSSIFKGVTYKQIRTLLKVISEYETNVIDFIKDRYDEREINFYETIELAKRISLVKEGDDCEIVLDKSLTNMALKDAPELIISRLLYSKYIHRNELKSFFSEFQVQQNRIVYIPKEINKSHYSYIRNFLLEIGIMSFDDKNDTYYLVSEYSFLFEDIISFGVTVSPDKLKKELISKELIGLDAEHTIIEYEKGRLDLYYHKNIEHVSLVNTSAGYDIKSVTVSKTGVCPRFIEVKAVPEESKPFHWSMNEINMAKKLGEWYYLYLLPIGNKRMILLDKLLIINNPYATIFMPNSVWNHEADGFKCWLS